jgi:hypothetical protein
MLHGLRKVLQEEGRGGLNLFRFNPKATCLGQMDYEANLRTFTLTRTKCYDQLVKSKTT